MIALTLIEVLAVERDARTISRARARAAEAGLHNTVSLVHEAGIRSGVNMEMDPALHNAFQEAGLPAPRTRLEMGLRRDPDFTRWVSDLLRSVLPQIQKLNLWHEALGDFDTLQERLQDEVAISNTVVPWIGLVAAWSRMPVN